MLKPHDRQLLLESLRPPAGYALDRAIGTTFSLDLVALLCAPLAFTFYEWEGDDGRPLSDPLALLRALREQADRIRIFCQAGQIQVPKRQQLLFSHLEDSVIEVRAPSKDGVFHPKVWAIRYTAEAQPVRYRLLCLTRNLTFDRSWDAMVALDGEVVDRERAIAANHSVGDFIEALPGLAVRPPTDEVRTQVSQIAAELRKVKWTPPEDFEEIRFWPLGIEGHRRWPFTGRIDRLMVVSPFLSPSCLKRLSETSDDCQLVSTLDTLGGMAESSLKRFKPVFFLQPEADPEPVSEEQDNKLGDTLRGLHAKLYIGDAGRNSSVWIGSANATHAAFESNVEFLVELVGRKSRCGIDALLSSEKGETSFRSLLQEFNPGPARPPDPDEAALQEALDKARRAVTAIPLEAEVASGSESGKYLLRLRSEAGAKGVAVAGVKVSCWPVTLPQASAKPLADGAALAEFGPLALESLTSFFAFEVTASRGTKSGAERFVRNLPLSGAPADRRERLLRSMLKDRAHLIRYLLFLLAESGSDAAASMMDAVSRIAGGADGSPGTLGLPLLESLLRALDRQPTRLDEVARVVNDLRNSPEGEDLLPPGFDSIWDPIWAVRRGTTA